MKINGKVITKKQYDAIEAAIKPIKTEIRLKLTHAIHDELGREIHNPKPVFMNIPSESDTPMTLDAKLMRIIRDRRAQYQEGQIESSEDLEDFGEDELENMETPYQVIDMEDPTEINQQDLDELAATEPKEEQKVPTAADLEKAYEEQKKAEAELTALKPK